jgi:hypothetical protein
MTTPHPWPTGPTRLGLKPVRAAALALVACGVAGGCGPGSHDVTGVVTYNGVPLDKPGGQIVFVGGDGRQVAAAVAPDGAYRAAGVPAGPNRVAVYYPNPKAQAKNREAGKLKPGERPPPPLPPYLTPEKYATPDTSGLTANVGPGATFNADLTGPRIP